MLKLIPTLTLLLAAALGPLLNAQAKEYPVQFPIEITVHLGFQHADRTINYPYMTVEHQRIDGKPELDLNAAKIQILGGSPDFPTPIGCFGPDYIDEDHYSSKYKDSAGNPAPMPFTISFKEGAALHSGSLRAYSHGCVHVDGAWEPKVFQIVKELGIQNTRICIYND